MTFAFRLRKTMPLFLVVVGSLMLALCSQWSLKNKESVVWVNNFEASDALPQNPLLLRAISAGFHGFAASVMWTNCIFSYADQILSGKSDAGFARKLNDVVELDTLWQYPYEFAGLTIEGSGRGSHPIGVEILALAARRFPLEGRIHILYSQAIMNASWIDSTKRLDSARKAMLPLMDSRVRAPEYARTLAITMAANIYGDREALRQLFYVMSSERDPMVRYALSRKLHPLLVGVTNFSGDSLQIFEEGISRVFQSGEVGIDKHLNALIDGLQNPVARPKVFNAIASILAQ